MSKLEDLIAKKTDLISQSDDDFFKSIQDLLPDNKGKLKEYLDQFEYKNGKLVNSEFNRKKLIGLRKELLKILESDYNINFTAYIKKFDDISELNLGIQSAMGVTVSNLEIGFAKKIMTDLVADQLALDKAVDMAIRPGIQQLLFKNVIGQANRKDTLEALTSFISKDQGVAQWSKVIARNTLGMYDGMVQQQLSTQYEYDGYFYTGSIIETSRIQCVHWVNDRKGFITFEELREDIPKYKNQSGYGSGMELTMESFPVVRGGHNCSHTATIASMPSYLKAKKQKQ